MFQRLGWPIGFGERKGESFVVGIFEQPAAVGLAFAFDEIDCFAHAWIGFGASGAEVVESPENVVVIAGREGEFEEFGIGDFAGGFAAEEMAIEEIRFGTVAGGGDFVAGICDCASHGRMRRSLTARSYSSSPSRTQIVV